MAKKQNQIDSQMATVPIVDIRENPVALRTVDKASEEFLGLVQSIREKGFISTITVRRAKDDESGKEYFELIDGLHRLTAAREAGHTTIDVKIYEVNEMQVLEMQLMANVHKIETKPIEYTQQLKRILAANRLLNINELAKKIGKSPQWIKQRFSLLKIQNETVIKLIDEGKINLSNAFALTKLPEEEIPNFLVAAQEESPSEFVPKATKRAKELREAKRKGQGADVEWSPSVYMQKMSEVKGELEDGKIGTVLCAGLKTPAEGFKRAIEWMLHLDYKSVEAQKAVHEERKALKDQKAKERAAKRDIEKAKKKKKESDEAAENAAKAAETLNKA